MCVKRTAELVLFTCCPPAPLAKDIHFDVLVADLDVDFLVHDRIDKHRREARVPPRLGIERRNPNEPVDAGLRTKESIRVLAADLEHGALDARLLALAHVEDLDAVS